MQPLGQGITQLRGHNRDRADISEFAKPSSGKVAKRPDPPLQRRVNAAHLAIVVDVDALSYRKAHVQSKWCQEIREARMVLAMRQIRAHRIDHQIAGYDLALVVPRDDKPSGGDCRGAAFDQNQSPLRHKLLDQFKAMRRRQEAVDVPVWPSMTLKTPLFVPAQTAPKFRSVDAGIVERGSPITVRCNAELAPPPNLSHQRQSCASERLVRGDELRIVTAGASMQQAVPGNTHDWALVAPCGQVSDDVDHGQSRADDDHASIGRWQRHGIDLPSRLYDRRSPAFLGKNRQRTRWGVAERENDRVEGSRAIPSKADKLTPVASQPGYRSSHMT